MSTTIEKTILAGGCFWGVQELFRKIDGVLKTEVGYTGDSKETANYEVVKTGSTNHAESLLIEFNPTIVSFSNLLEDHFFRLHDPTTKDQQGNDVGRQYRSAIFYFSEEQKQAAVDAIIRSEASELWGRKPFVTEILPAGDFFSAEDYHQDYLQKNPGGYTCHFYR